MPNIFMRDVPEELYQKFAEVARRDHRSIPGEVLHLMEEAIQADAAGMLASRAALRRLAERRRITGRLPMQARDVVREIREDGE